MQTQQTTDKNEPTIKVDANVNLDHVQHVLDNFTNVLEVISTCSIDSDMAMSLINAKSFISNQVQNLTHHKQEIIKAIDSQKKKTRKKATKKKTSKAKKVKRAGATTKKKAKRIPAKKKTKAKKK